MSFKEKLLVGPLGVLRLLNCSNESELTSLTLVPHILVHAHTHTHTHTHTGSYVLALIHTLFNSF